MELPERKIFTVSELTERVREILEREYPSIWIQGEVSNFRHAPSGHMYFTLKDEAAQIRCVMFKMQSRFLKFRIEDGLKVIAWGRLTVYTLRGEYQLILDTMEPAGLGSLMLAFEQLKSRLAAEGLFHPERKKPLPHLPRRIGLVTSPRGAAIRDMIRIITRRFPAVHILVSPATVQGDRAPDEIVAAIHRLCSAGDVEVIVVGRGGGAVEDLWAFNDERVVGAVAECPLPVISAVGHETDVTLTDFAADVRASTPSAASEIVIPDKRDLQAGIVHLSARLRNGMLYSLEKSREAVNETLKRLYDPRRQIEERRMAMDDLTMRLGRGIHRRLTLLTRDTGTVVERLRPEHLNRVLLLGREECAALYQRLAKSMRDALKDSRNAAESLSAQLDTLSPLAVLSRGYSVTLRADTGAVVIDADSVETGEEVHVRLHRGRLACRVIGKQGPEEIV